MFGGIINYFGENLIGSLLLQGSFFAICVILGMVYLVDRINKSRFEFSRKPVAGKSRATDEACGGKDKSGEGKSDNSVEVISRLGAFFDEVLSYLNLSVIFNKNLQDPNTGRSAKFANAFATLVISLFVLFLFIFASGILVNRVSDNFLDRSPQYHLGLKMSWLDTCIDEKKPKRESYTDPVKYLQDSLRYHKGYLVTRKRFDTEIRNNSDYALRIAKFYQLFPAKSYIDNSDKVQIYYNVKHKLLTDPLWRNYLESTQMLVNYSQVLVFSFLTMFIIFHLALCVNIVSLAKNMSNMKRSGQAFFFVVGSVIMYSLAIWLICKYGNTWWAWIPAVLLPVGICLLQLFVQEKSASRIVVNTILLLGSFVCYHAAGVSWRDNEGEFDLKVYGVYKATTPHFYLNEQEIFEENGYHLVKNTVDAAHDSIVLDSLRLQRLKTAQQIEQCTFIIDSLKKRRAGLGEKATK